MPRDILGARGPVIFSVAVACVSSQRVLEPGLWHEPGLLVALQIPLELLGLWWAWEEGWLMVPERPEESPTTRRECGPRSGIAGTGSLSVYVARSQDGTSRQSQALWLAVLPLWLAPSPH